MTPKLQQEPVPVTVEFLSGGGETSKDVVRPEKMVNNDNLSRQWKALGVTNG